MITDCVYYANIGFLSDESTFCKWLLSVGEDRRQKVEKFKISDDKRRSLCAEILLLSALSDLGFSLDKIEYGYNDYGKPFIKEYPDFHFSISHSGDYAVCAVSDCEVGCDIEKIEDVDIGIAKRFFSEREYKKIESTDTKTQAEELFFRYWTLKESYIKCLGTGLKTPLSDFEISLEGKTGVTVNGKTADFSFVEFDGINGYKCAFCKMGKIAKVKVHKKIF